MPARPYDLVGPIGARGTLGLIVLQVDETIEQDFRRLFPDPGVAIHVSRIPSGAELTPDTIATMRTDLPRAAALLPPAAAFDAIGYACTSGATLIGPDAVAALVSGRRDNPDGERSADRVDRRAEGVGRPFRRHRVALCHVGGRARADRVPQSGVRRPRRDLLRRGGRGPGRTDRSGLDPRRRDRGRGGAGVQAVFLSCTNLRTLDIIEDLESRLGMPVTSSNQTLAWHMARAAGAPLMACPPGRLFRT